MNIEAYAKRLRLPFIRQNYKELAAQAREDHLDYEEFLEKVLKGETISRNENCIQKRIQLAHFPNRMSLEDFQTEHLRIEIQQKVKELSTLDFIKNGENVILIGNPGTGKSALSICLGMEACLNNMSVLFIGVSDLLIEIREAMSQNQLLRYKKRFESFDLVILDKLGYCSFDQKSGEILFNLISSRNGKKSLIVTSNLELNRWSEIFKDEVLTLAMIDRLAYKACMINMTGQSYRLRETKKWVEEKSEKARHPLGGEGRRNCSGKSSLLNPKVDQFSITQLDQFSIDKNNRLQVTEFVK